MSLNLVREMTLENGGKVYFKTDPVHPYWTVNFDSGNVPRKLRGYFQYYDDAVAAVERYLATRPRNKTAPTKKVVEKEV